MTSERSIRVIEKPNGQMDIAIDETSPVVAHDARERIREEITPEAYRPGEVIGSLRVMETPDGPDWEYDLHEQEWRARRG